jgi:hypothetical protein
MQDRTLYARLLGIEDPLRVTDVGLRLDEAQEVIASFGLDQGVALHCPKCEGSGSRSDSRDRRWRHLDTMQPRTILVAQVPRARVSLHGSLRGARHRLASGSQLLRGHPSTFSELGSGGRNPGGGRRTRGSSEWRVAIATSSASTMPSTSTSQGWPSAQIPSNQPTRMPEAPEIEAAFACSVARGTTTTRSPSNHLQP